MTRINFWTAAGTYCRIICGPRLYTTVISLAAEHGGLVRCGNSPDGTGVLAIFGDGSHLSAPIVNEHRQVAEEGFFLGIENIFTEARS